MQWEGSLHEQYDEWRKVQQPCDCGRHSDVSFINIFFLQPSYAQFWSNFDDPAETAETIGWMLSD
jgi:hypothetical protein